MSKKKSNFLKHKLRTFLAGVLSTLTLASSVSVPVTVYAEETTDVNEENHSRGVAIPENAIGVDVHGEGSVIVEQNGEEKEITELTMFYGEAGDTITIKASEKDLPMTGFAVFKNDKTALNANPDCEPEASYTATIGKDRYANVVFEEVNYDNSASEAYTNSDINSLASSGSGQLWATSITGDMFGNEFQLQWINGPLAPFTNEIAAVLGQCSMPGWLSWHDGNPYGVDSLDYSYTATKRDGAVYLDITVAPDETHTGWSADLGATVGYQGIEWRSLRLELPTRDVNISVVKNSENKAVTDNNPNYSLEGAVYKVCTAADCNEGSKVGTITTDKDGNGSTGKLTVDGSVTTLYAQEVTPSKGFKLDTNIYTISINNDGTGKFNSTEPITKKNFDISAVKIWDKATSIQESNSPSLAGAEYTVKYYAVDYTTHADVDSVKDLAPTRTWVMKTKASTVVKDGVTYPTGEFKFTDEYKIAGNNFYVDDSGKTYLPLGVVTIEETKAPEAYKLNSAVQFSKVTDDNKPLAISNSGYKATDSSIEIYESPIPSSFKIQKVDKDLNKATTQGDAQSLSAKYVLTNKSEVTRTIYNSDSNVTVAKAKSGEAFKDVATGEDYIFTTDDKGFYDLKAQGLTIDEGTYEVKEVEAPVGYNLDATPVVLDLTEGNAETAQFEQSDTVMRGGFKVQKYDSETVTRAQGTADLTMEFKIVNKSEHSVIVNGVEYAKDATVFKGTTNAKGYYESAKDLLPYGTYQIVETKAPNAYRLDSEASTFTIRSANEVADITAKQIKNNSEKGRITIHKVTDIQYAGSSWSENEESAVFGVVLKQYVDKYGSVELALAHQYGVSEAEITDRDWLKENLFADGNTAVTLNKDGADADKMTGQEYAVLRTDVDGNASSGPDSLVLGEYVVKQLASPNEEISVNKTETTVLFQQDGEVKHIETSNTAEEYYLQLVKKDAVTGETITFHSTDFKIYTLNADGSKKYITMDLGKVKYDTFRTTSETGQLTDKLGNKLPKGTFYVDSEDEGTATTPLTVTAGTYYIEEVGAPENYTLAEDIKVVVKKGAISETDDQGNQYITTVMHEAPVSGTLKIEKSIEDYEADANFVDRNALSQIQFTLTAAEDILDPATGEVIVKKGEIAKNTSHEAVGQFYLSDNGKAEVSGILMGKYVLSETKIPSSLALNAETWNVEFKQDKDDSSKLTYEVKLAIENTPTKVEISKKAVTGEDELAGATLEVLDQNGNKIDSWVSGNEPHKIAGLLRGTTYTLRGTITPEDSSYARATDVQFTVNDDGSVTKVKMINKFVDMTKVDVGGKEVAGAKMVVTDMEGKVVDSWTSTDEAHKIKNLVEKQTYTLHEETAAEGYVKASDITFTVKGADEKGAKENQHVEMTDKRVEISKVDVGGEEVKGAILKIVNTDGETVDTWTSGDSTHFVSGLEVGKTYTLIEDTTPAGYVTATSITFTVTDDGVDQKIEMVDTIERIAKVDDKGEYIKGAKLEAYDENGKLIDLWTSGRHLVDFTEDQVITLKNGGTVEMTLPSGAKIKAMPVIVGDEVHYELMTQARGLGYYDIDLNGDETTHRLYGLSEGQKYTVKEVATPDGYYTADDVAVVPEANENHLQAMVDNTINYKIAKVNEKGEYVEGVKLKLEDITDEENPVEVALPNEGVTTDAPFELSNVLICGHTYKLTETETVDGYSMPKTASLNFTVDTHGTSDFITISMINVANKIVVMKVDENGLPLKDAKMQILKGKEVSEEVKHTVYDPETKETTEEVETVTKVVPETDEEGNPVVLHEWVTTGEPEDIGAYVKGGTDDKYILREVSAPWGYDAIEDTPFTVDLVEDSTGMAQIVYATDKRSIINVKVVKVDAESKETVLEGAEFTLYNKDNKVVVDKNGKDCVAVTDKNGELKFNVSWQAGMYVKETKAPKNYKLNDNKFNITPEENVFDFTKDYEITVTDEKVPVTSVKGVAGFIVIGVAAGAGLYFLLKKKKENKGE